MLVSLIALMALLVNGEFSWLSSDTSHVAPAEASPRVLITPEEPVTLTLALIGLGIVGVYLLASRTLWRPRRAGSATEQRSAEVPGEIERRSRGAA